MSGDIEKDAWSSDVVMPVLRVSRSPLLQVWPSEPSCLDTNERDAVVKSKNPQDMMAVMSKSMQERTGRSMQESDKPASELLVQAKAPGQATHKLSLTSMEEITGEVERLLRMAYDQNG